MANDFSSDSNCISLYNWESGASGTDSKGSDTLSFSTNQPQPQNLGSSGIQQPQGSWDNLFQRANSDYAYRTDTNLSSSFPLKSGTSNKTITVCGWLNLRTAPSGGEDMFLFGKTDFSGHRSWAAMVEDFSGTPKLLLDLGKSDGTFSEQFIHASGLTTGTWYHVSLSYRDSDKAIALRIRNSDGTTLGSDVTGTAAQNIGLFSSTDFMLGTLGSAASTAGGYLDAYCDEVVIFSKLITATDSTNISKGLYSGSGDTGGTNTNFTPTIGAGNLSGVASSLVQGSVFTPATP